MYRSMWPELSYYSNVHRGASLFAIEPKNLHTSDTMCQAKTLPLSKPSLPRKVQSNPFTLLPRNKRTSLVRKMTNTPPPTLVRPSARLPSRGNDQSVTLPCLPSPKTPTKNIVPSASPPPRPKREEYYYDEKSPNYPIPEKLYFPLF